MTKTVGRYYWNAENRMVRAEELYAPTNREPYVITYNYDYKGRMVRKDVALASNPSFSILHSTFVWDGWNIIRETTTDLSTSQPFNFSTDYVWGLDLDGSLQGAGGVGGLLAVVRGDGTYLPTYDANGNVSEYIDDSDGSIVAHYDYSPFGELLIQQGDLANTFLHRFSTKPYCPITKLCEYQLRKYRPEIGRWLSRDPIEEKGGMNLLAFVSNEPIDSIEDLGNQTTADNSHPWTSTEALAVFYYGNGGTFTLQMVGHYDTITRHVNEAVRDWENGATEKIRREAQKVLSRTSIIKSVFTFDKKYQGLYSGVFWIGGIALRKNYFCSASFDCKSDKIQYQCEFDYSMNDTFSDPYDIFNKIPGDINIGGTPFTVTVKWHKELKGSFKP